jgi:sporulation protein YlmC with PRC-barrel domain
MYGAADQYGVDRALDRYGNPQWPQGQAAGVYGSNGSQAYGQYGQQAYGGEGNWQQRGPQQGQVSAWRGYDSDMGRHSDAQPRFGSERPGGEEPSYYGQADQQGWWQQEMQRRQQAYNDQGYAGPYGGYGYNQGYGPPRSMGDRQMGQSPYETYPYSGYGGQYGQAWPDRRRFEMESGGAVQDRFHRGGGENFNRFAEQGGYPDSGRYDRGQMGYGPYGGPMMGGQMMQQPGPMMGGQMMQQPGQMMGGQMMQQPGQMMGRQGYGMEYGRPYAQGDQQAAGPGAVQVVSAGALVGRRVTDASGTEIGTTRYVVIGAQSGRVHFVMVGSGEGDALGLGTDLLPVPWSAVRQGGDESVRLAIEADRLKELPHVAPADLASVVGPQIVGQVRQLVTAPAGGQSDGSSQQQAEASGQQQGSTGEASGAAQQQSQSASEQPSAGGAGDQIASTEPGGGSTTAGEDIVVLGGRYGALVAPPSLVTEGELTGTTVFTADGMPIGDIDEILIDQRRGQVAYVLVSVGGFLGADQRWLPVPFTAMTWMPTRAGFALQIQSGQLADMPELAQGTPPRSIRARDLARLYQAYGAPPYWQGAGGPGAVDDRG